MAPLAHLPVAAAGPAARTAATPGRCRGRPPAPGAGWGRGLPLAASGRCWHRGRYAQGRWGLAGWGRVRQAPQGERWLLGLSRRWLGVRRARRGSWRRPAALATPPLAPHLAPPATPPPATPAQSLAAAGDWRRPATVAGPPMAPLAHRPVAAAGPAARAAATPGRCRGRRQSSGDRRGAPTRANCRWR